MPLSIQFTTTTAHFEKKRNMGAVKIILFSRVLSGDLPFEKSREGFSSVIVDLYVAVDAFGAKTEVICTVLTHSHGTVYNIVRASEKDVDNYTTHFDIFLLECCCV